MSERQAIVIQVMSRAPVPGQVKTRLIPALGNAGAARAHTTLLRDMLRRLSILPWPVQLWCTPDVRHPVLQALAARYGVELKRQKAGDLGMRMAHILHTALQQGYWPLLCGSDVGGLQARDVAQAVTALQRGAELVFAPCEDGGYGLLGARRLHDGCFQGLPWGSPGLWQQQQQRLQAIGVNWQTVRTIWDVDEPADWRRYRALHGA